MRDLVPLTLASPRRAHAWRHPDVEWALSGAMSLTGPADGAPVLAPAPIASAARQAIDALERLAGHHLGVDGPALLGERAALLGLSRRGSTSPGGSSRLMRCADGWVAVTLARPDDVASLPAWLGEGDTHDPWTFVRDRLATRTTAAAVARARLLALPVTGTRSPPATPRHHARVGPSCAGAPRHPLVVDLSSLWAGPLCTHLLGKLGARVVKVESADRPDGARRGHADFFDLLNAGKASVALDFGSTCGREQLRRLVDAADIVVESARPRALEQLGIFAEEPVARGTTWVSITGYGRAAPFRDWVAFGDDAAVAGGLVATTLEGLPMFCGDAVADPLTGMHAALFGWEAYVSGDGGLVAGSLADTAATVWAREAPAGEAQVLRGRRGFEVEIDGRRTPVSPPRARPGLGRAAALGTHTREVLSWMR